MGHSLSTFISGGTPVHACSKNPHQNSCRLAIIDSNRTKAELLIYFCINYWGFDVVAFESSGATGLAAILDTKPDLIIAALNPSDVGMIECIQRLRVISSSAKLLILTSLCNEYLVHLLSASGYHGLIWDVEVGLSSLGEVIDKVRKGIRTVSTSILRCQTRLRAAPTSFPKVLSNRHLEVLVCIGHSMSDEEIGAHFCFSTGTALSHRYCIMRKLDIHSTPKLIRYCIEKGFSSVQLPAASRTQSSYEICSEFKQSAVV